jgi:hypothetical protein
MTLIAWGDSSGTRRRCDAHCYNAKMARCTCICGGRNHGQGLDRARAQTAEWAQAHLAVLAAQGDMIAQGMLDAIGAGGAK